MNEWLCPWCGWFGYDGYGTCPDCGGDCEEEDGDDE